MGMLMTFQDSIYQMELCGIQFPPDLGLHFLHLLCVCSLLRTCVQKRWKRTMEFQVSLWYYIHSVVSFDHFSGGHMHCSNISISLLPGVMINLTTASIPYKNTLRVLSRDIICWGNQTIYKSEVQENL